MPHEWGGRALVGLLDLDVISIHAPEGAAWIHCRAHIGHNSLRFAPLRETALSMQPPWRERSFNSRLVKGGPRPGCPQSRPSHYNPLPTGRQHLHAQLNRGVVISIHAPREGVTRAERLSGLRQAISIHAPVKGATARYGSRNRPTNVGPTSHQAKRKKQKGRQLKTDGPAIQIRCEPPLPDMITWHSHLAQTISTPSGSYEVSHPIVSILPE